MKKNNIVTSIVLIFLMIQSILDMLTTILPDIQISIIVRGAFFAFTVCYLLYKKFDLKINILLICLMLGYISYSYFYLDYGLIASVGVTLKLFYLPYILLLFKNLEYDKRFKHVLIISLLMYLGIYLLSYIFNFGYSAYMDTDGKTGFRGVFNSINEFSAIVIILYYYVFDFLKNKYKSIFLIIISILLIIVAYLTGTKVLMGGIILVILINVLPILFNLFKKLSVKKRILFSFSCLLLVIVVGYLFTLTTAFKNMLVQAEFFEVSNFLSFNGINRVIFNDRLSFIGLNLNYFSNCNFIEYILGMGFNANIKLVEIDFFDILFRYGLVGISIIVASFVLWFRSSKIKLKSLLGIGLLLLFSFTSGHIIIYPAVCIYFGVTVLLNKNI